MPLVTDLPKIKQIAEEKQAENDLFRDFLKQQDDEAIDSMVHTLTETITPQIDCTQCGNCCKSLMINITKEETDQLASHLQISETQLIDQCSTMKFAQLFSMWLKS